MGYLPSPYLETIRRPQGQIAAKSNATSPAGSRVNTMTGSTVAPGSRTSSMKITEKEKAEIKKAPREPLKEGIESFQRGGYYG
jgi:peroxin-13